MISLHLMKGMLSFAIYIGSGLCLVSRLPQRKNSFYQSIQYSNYLRNLELKASVDPIAITMPKALTETIPSGKEAKVVIIGGGPAGLASAIMLARRGYTNIKVYDRLEEPSAPDDASVWNDFEGGRNYNIGVNGRGQRALADLGVLEKIDSFSAKCIGRLEWSPQSAGEPKETITTGRSFNPKIIQRERLASCLLDEIREKYGSAVTVKYQSDCTHVEWTHTGKEEELCHLKVKQRTLTDGEEHVSEFTEQSSFVIGADGAQSSVRTAMEEDKLGGFFVKKYEDKNVRVYRTIPLHFPKGSKEDKLGKKWRGDLNYSVRTKSDINIDALPTKEGPYYGVVLFRPWDERFSKMKTGADAKAFFDEVLPMFSPIVRTADLERFAAQKDSKLPRFSYVGPILHRGRTTCLLGDCIHTVKPYFGVGVNSALEDVMVLNSALNSCDDNVPQAMEKYSSLRAKDTEAIVKMSARLDGGFFSFVLPLIVDSILNKFLPAVFSPNTIKSLQDPDKTFSEVKKRKRLDRVLQIILGISIFSMIGKSLLTLFGVSKLILSKKIQFQNVSLKIPDTFPLKLSKNFPYFSW